MTSASLPYKIQIPQKIEPHDASNCDTVSTHPSFQAAKGLLSTFPFGECRESGIKNTNWFHCTSGKSLDVGLLPLYLVPLGVSVQREFEVSDDLGASESPDSLRGKSRTR